MDKNGQARDDVVVVLQEELDKEDDFEVVLVVPGRFLRSQIVIVSDCVISGTIYGLFSGPEPRDIVP